LRGAPADQRTARLFSMKYYVIEIHPSDCITPSPPPVRVSAYFKTHEHFGLDTRPRCSILLRG
ncbi:Uncharacterized protein HZ326_4962, partial [Fusarium oxysporum f. sp. albedinis]